MLWVAGDGSINDTTTAAGFAQDWADDRSDRAAKKKAKADAPPKAVDPEAAAKRLEKRLGLMTAGAEEFETWLTDLYRTGFANARQQPYSFWEQPAARLLDSQLPGLSQRVRDVPSKLYGDDWTDILLAETGRWYTAVKAWQRRDGLDAADLANLRVFLGWPVMADDVRREPALDDTWIVQGLHRTDDGRLKSQRTWLYGTKTDTQAVLLDFAAAGAFLELGHVVGSRVEASLWLYPGSGVRRALLGDTNQTPASKVELHNPVSVAQALDHVAEHIAINPFADEHPMCIRAFVDMDAETETAYVIDANGDRLRLDTDFDPWPLLARCANHEVAMFGEFSNGRFLPLTAEIDRELVPV